MSNDQINEILNTWQKQFNKDFNKDFNKTNAELNISQKLYWPVFIEYLSYVNNKAILNAYNMITYFNIEEQNINKFRELYKDLFPEYFI